MLKAEDTTDGLRQIVVPLIMLILLFQVVNIQNNAKSQNLCDKNKWVVPSIGVNRNGGVNRNSHQKSSSDLNFSKLKIHKLFI